MVKLFPLEVIKKQLEILKFKSLGLAADLSTVSSDYSVTPAAWVLPAGVKAVDAGNEYIRVTNNFYILIAVTNSKSSLGSRDDLQSLLERVIKTLTNKELEDWDGVVFNGGEVVNYERSTLWYRLDFSVSTICTFTDNQSNEADDKTNQKTDYKKTEKVY